MNKRIKRKKFTKTQIFRRAEYRRLMKCSREEFDQYISHLKMRRTLHDNLPFTAISLRRPLPAATGDKFSLFSYHGLPAE